LSDNVRKAFPVFEGAKTRFLGDIPSVLIVPRQPSRQVVCGIQPLQNHLVESRRFVLV
jgi:hypothetical protein